MLFTILLIILSTSLLSGVLGMGGGMILMGALSLFLPFATAILLHGIIQFHSNLFRAILNKSYIKWKIFPLYLCGSFVSYSILQLIIFYPSKKFMFIGLGLLPFLSLFLSNKVQLNITKKSNSFICGLLVTFLQIIIGTSGPILDLFFLKSPLVRQEIISTKAITQSLSHFIKIIFYIQYFFKSNESFTLPPYFIAIAIFFSFLGTKFGKLLLDKINEKQFHNYSRFILFTIGLLYLYRGGTMT